MFSSLFPQPNKNTKKILRPIFMLESHANKHIFLDKLLPLLVQEGYLTLLNERKDDLSIDERIDNNEKVIKQNRKKLEGVLNKYLNKLGLNEEESTTIQNLLTESTDEINQNLKDSQSENFSLLHYRL